MNIIDDILSFIERYLYWMDFSGLRLADMVEILIITFLLYQALAWIKRSRAMSLLKGIVVILAGVLVAAIFQMNTIVWIAEKLFNAGLIALIVVFQPELRYALEHLGQKSFFKGIFNFDSQDKQKLRETNRIVEEISRACVEMGRVKTGALIVFEKKTPLDEFIRTGIAVDSLITRQLLINIFEKNTPLHDGAVIMKDNRVAAATCYLPLSDNMEISKSLGTRHRAAIGISEVSDALTIVVSEETGMISVAYNGGLSRDLTGEELEVRLHDFLRTEGEETSPHFKKRRVSDSE